MNDFTNIPQELKEKLNQSIVEAIICRNEYIREEERKRFIRNRKLNIETMIKSIICMKGGSLSKELNCMNMDVTASAFVQQRKNLSWWEFENVLEYFNQKCKDTKLYKGYRVLAVDGTAVNLARDPKEKSSCKMPATQRDIISYMLIRCMMC